MDLMFLEKAFVASGTGSGLMFLKKTFWRASGTGSGDVLANGKD